MYAYGHCHVFKGESSFWVIIRMIDWVLIIGDVCVKSLALKKDKLMGQNTS